MSRYKYEHIINIIKDKIQCCEYKPGSKLPSIQALAKEFSLNTDTVIRAYRLLESEHLIYSVPKSGYYVVESTTVTDKEPCIIDMLSTTPAYEVNPYKDFYHCMVQAISLNEHKLFTNSPVKGTPELIGILKKHVVNYQIFAREEDIFITSGAQQALFILSSMSFSGERDTILVEQPTYHILLEALNVNKIPVMGITRTADGLDLTELERIFAQNRIKFFYLMTRFQNPTGFSYSNKQKKEILKMAKKYHVYIVEDDYLADLEVNTKNDPFISFDNDNLVVYVRSFSKTLLPGLRLGMAVVPELLQKEFIRKKSSIDLSSSVFSQCALEIYLRSGMNEAHIKQTKLLYKKKMEALRLSCKQNLENLARLSVPQTGIFTCLEIDSLSSNLIVDKLENNGVKAMSISSSYINGFTHSDGIRLCICKPDIQDIANAIKILRQILLT